VRPPLIRGSVVKTDSVDLLSRLIAFPTVSCDSNLELIQFVAAHLEAVGVAVQIMPDETGRKANLYATVGPADRPGVMLSGHTDVVPVQGQDWTVPPFQMTDRDGRLYGRGSADMKGFVACAVSAMVRAASRDLSTPLHLALSYDEEIGCVGVHEMIDVLARAQFRPLFGIVGEPTGLSVATGHKGKTALNVVCTGRAAHSALAPTGVNAIHLATDLIQLIRDTQTDLAERGQRDVDYDIPYSTLHVGKISGGTVLNIVPNRCELAFEIRTLASDDPMTILERVRADAEPLVKAARRIAPESDMSIEVTNSYPGLDTPKGAPVVAFARELLRVEDTKKVAYGTEGGLFHQRLGVPVVVCGPGSMDQGHQPDEFVTRAQIEACDQMLEILLAKLKMGL